MTILSVFGQEKPSRAVLITGPEALLNDYIARAYCHEPQFKDDDLVQVDCEQDGLDELLAALMENSLFSPQKLILVKNPYFLTSKVPQKDQAKVKQLQQIFANLPELTDALVIVASYERIDQRRKITKLLKKYCLFVSTAVKPYQLGDFFKKLSKQEGVPFEPGALKLLLERSDQVMATALGNYAKLKAICNGQVITQAMVRQNIDRSLAQNVFAILEKALAGQVEQAVMRLDDQLREGVAPAAILAVFASQLEFQVCVKTLAQRGRSEMEITKQLNAHPYRIKLALRSRTNLTRLRRLLREVIELDFRYKNGTYQDSIFLKTWVLGI
ncbi:MAG: DNA polymerase III subunit delta [Lactobacillus sp.]|jgi:DNA polymerase-3 subunit delta|nr:DNA polymerase III subunit delta [Lactobacillus sp.]MCH3989971.1 DNA polymerase III subunit delta [Lactobacillus sp.]MCH4069315.1 DNA polymerase III subunit delta [Lactobacillus sp.]MCI1303698.1 DNA polymerase III subunit delta [Lactobacillus sp.]MCI1329793.1 DNA polymerase III subunit delta [Lactobacillus sp.]